MGSTCCANNERGDMEALKHQTSVRSPILNQSKDELADLQLSEVMNSEEEEKHGPSKTVATKLKSFPVQLSQKLESLARDQSKFEYRNDNEMVDKAIFLGLRQFDNQSIYIGQWYEKKRNGRGQQIYQDGSVYEGYWLNDKREGYGRFIDFMGDVYEGDWVNDSACGRGKYTQKGGAYYYGDWQDNKQNGQGREKWPTGETYEGQYKDGFKHGLGTFRMTAGSYYYGNFIKDKIEGQGRVMK